ncbi:MAG TPA: hypothetical protein DCE41_14870 [Cytophagales bacterium]|nr:hypothetical protein [Cytophagales bacterium]HAA22575.1 hypothetical protein [Cytophagales bacterium]HAP64715.1 hypothetical protein [Cytophagales bacterium]
MHGGILAVVLASLKFITMAQKTHIASTEQHLYIHLSVDQLWKITALDFANIGAWSAGVNTSAGQGEGLNGSVCTERVCVPSYKGFKPTTERFTLYDPEQYTFTYQIVQGLPKAVAQATNT